MGSFPIARTKSNAARIVASLVVIVRTTSTSRIAGTGLKKCSPMKRSPRVVAVACSTIDSDEVFEAKMVCGAASVSSAAQSARLASSCSTTASTMMSHDESAPRSVVKVRVSSVRSRASGEIFPFSMSRESDRSMALRARAHSASSSSRRMVRCPCCAATWAMPAPMSPPPTTPTVPEWVIPQYAPVPRHPTARRTVTDSSRIPST